MAGASKAVGCKSELNYDPATAELEQPKDRRPLANWVLVSLAASARCVQATELADSVEVET
jgi:hypothetical protein